LTVKYPVTEQKSEWGSEGAGKREAKSDTKQKATTTTSVAYYSNSMINVCIQAYEDYNCHAYI